MTQGSVAHKNGFYLFSGKGGPNGSVLTIYTLPHRILAEELTLQPKGHKVKNRHREAVAKGNHDDAEMDSPTPANGKLDVCLQSPGIRKSAKEKTKSVKSENRPLYCWKYNDHECCGYTGLQWGCGSGNHPYLADERDGIVREQFHIAWVGG